MLDGLAHMAHCTGLLCSTACTLHLHFCTLALLHITVPPEITPFTFPKLAEGARIQVACTVHQGDLPLNLTWLKNWSPLPSHIRITPFDTYSSIVTMNSVKRGDSGNYTCVASNSARVTTHTAHLTISGKLPCSFLSQPDGLFKIALENDLIEFLLW
jgi:hypothetical protein